MNYEDIIPTVNPGPITKEGTFGYYTVFGQYTYKGTTLMWSGRVPLPTIGSIVELGLNGFGRVKVVSYFAEAGFLGFIGKPLSKKDAPTYWLKQNKGKLVEGHFFGVDIKEVLTQA